MRYLILLLTIICCFAQCTKDDMGMPKACIPHESLSTASGIAPLFIGTLPKADMPYFNPNDANEIIYRYTDETNPTFDLIKYNLTTRQKEVLYQGSFSNRPRWGKNGWILLNVKDNLDYNIYKIKDNGTELTNLTISGNCFNPEWSISNNTFIYELGLTSPTEFIISNQNGIIIDTTLVGVGSVGSWQHDTLVVNGTFKGLFAGNPYSGFYDYDLISDVEDNAQSSNGAEWLDDENVFWCHTTGIYTTNISAKETKVIRETCNAHCYQHPTYAPSINKIVLEKLERIKDTETSGRAIITLVMMNPDGTDEMELDILD